MNITKNDKICGTITVPGDKSISHRALMFTALAEGKSEIFGLATCQDVQSTMQCLKDLGVKITTEGNKTIVEGRGLLGLKKPGKILDAGNSGTTMRLLSGILCGQNFESSLTGDTSLQKRPMKRIIEPLQLMGAKIGGTQNKFAPLNISPAKLQRFDHKLKVASAQVKSCLLLAGLFSEGKTTVFEPAKSRDHTERMMKYLGADISVKKNSVSINGFPSLKANSLTIPGDISSAAFFLVAASIIKNSTLKIKNVGINLSRTGILDLLKMMGADFRLKNKKIHNNEKSADIDIFYNQLIGIEIGGALIPRIIDEIPVLAIAATQAEGQTIIKDAKELRVKETDRITAVVENLKKMGANITELADGMIIEGKQKLSGAEINSFGDHRIAMAFAVAGLLAEGITTIKNPECVDISFPDFFQKLEEIRND